MRKTEKYNLFGIDVIFSERNMADVLKLEQLYSDKVNGEKDEKKKVYLNIEFGIIRIVDCLSYWLNSIYFLRRYYLRRKWFNVKYLLNNLSSNEFQEIINILNKLEGFEDKKKMENRSAE